LAITREKFGPNSGFFSLGDLLLIFRVP